MKDFISKFESLLDYSCSEEKETLILGDLNCDLAAKKLSADTKELCMLFKVYQFIQLIKEPTRIVERSSTLLDLAFTTDQGKISDSGVLECSISDHSLVYIIRKARPPRGPIKTIKCWSYRNYSTSFPGFSPTCPLSLRRAGRREPWERGWELLSPKFCQRSTLCLLGCH